MASQTSTPSSRANIGDLVDQRDVDVPEGVLQQLGQLGLLRPEHRDDPLDQARRRAPSTGPSDASSIPETTFGVFTEAPRRVAGVDALRAVADVEVDAGREPDRLLQQRDDRVPRSSPGRWSTRGRRSPRAQVRGERPAGALDEAKVGRDIPQRRRHRDDRHVEPAAVDAPVVAR